MASYDNCFYGTSYFQSVIRYIVAFCHFYSICKCSLQVIDHLSRNLNQKVLSYPINLNFSLNKNYI